MKNEDVELIHRILAGDETAFVDLVNKYQKQVHALAWRKIGDFHIAEEITQDTFLKVYQKLTTLKDPNQFSGWLYVIATRQCLSWLRKKRIETESLEDADTEWIDETAYSRYVAEEHAKATAEAQREVVKKLLAKLKESERTVMTLHYLGEMTVEEISRFLGVSTSAIKLRLHRARQRLQKEEPMIREALSNFQLSPNFTENIIKKIENIKPAAPSGSQPFIPWVIGASSIALIVLLLGIGSRYLVHFQPPYSLDAQSEMAVELVDTPVVLNLETKPDVRNRLGESTDNPGRGNDTGQESNQVISDEGDYTQWGLPENAKARLSKGNINDIRFSPDGTQIAVASGTGVWIYDAHTGDELTLLTNHITPTAKVTISPDSSKLATGEADEILLWDIGTGKLIKSFRRENSVIKKLKIMDDNNTLICVGYDSIQLWDISIGTQKNFMSKSSKGFKAKLEYILGRSVTAVDLHINKNTDESILAVGNEKGAIRLEDPSNGKTLKTLCGHTVRDDRVFLLAFSPDGTLLVSNTVEKPLSLWDVTSGKLLKTLTQAPKLAGILQFSNDGKTLACQSSSGYIELWDVDTQTLRTTFDEVHALAFSSDSKIVTGANKKGEIKVWDSETGDEISSFSTGHTRGFGGLTFSPDSRTLVSRHGKTIMFWDTFNFTQLCAPINTDTYPTAMAFSTKDMTFITAGHFTFKMKKGIGSVNERLFTRLSVWETHTGNKLSELPVESVTGSMPKRIINSQSSVRGGDIVVFSKNGYILATVLNSQQATKDNRFTIHLWAVPYGESHAILKGHTARINTLVFTPDGKTLASGSNDGTIRIWDTSTGTEMLSLPSDKFPALAISVDGKILTSSTTDNIQLWDVSTGTQLKSLKVKDDLVTALAFAPNGKILTGGSRDGTIQLWDIATGDKLSTLKGHTFPLRSLSFSPDGKTLASGSSDGAIFLWDLTSLTNTNQNPR